MNRLDRIIAYNNGTAMHACDVGHCKTIRHQVPFRLYHGQIVPLVTVADPCPACWNHGISVSHCCSNAETLRAYIDDVMV
jgi:hypothetical protein